MWKYEHMAIVSRVQSENAKKLCYIINIIMFTSKYKSNWYATQLSSDKFRKNYKLLTDYNGLVNLIDCSYS